MKRAAVVLGIVVVLILAIALAIPFLVDANQFRPTLETKLSQVLGRQVKIGDLKLTILTASVKASDVSISDDPAFGSIPFLRAQSVKIAVKLVPLITSRKLNVTGIAIQNPEVDLIQDASGAWNFSSLGSRPPVRPAASLLQAPHPSFGQELPTAAQEFSVADVEIANGRVTLQRIGGKAKPITLDKTTIEVKNFSELTSSPFSLTASLPAGGGIKLEGNAGPVVAGDAISTPIDAKLSLSHLDLIESGAVDPTLGLAGLVSMVGSVKSDHASVSVQGQLKAEEAKFSRGGSPAKRPLELDFAVQHNLRSLTGTVQRANIHIGGAVVSLTGTYDLHAAPAEVNLKLLGSKMPLTELASVLPALGIVVPGGAQIEAGTAEVNLASRGPLDKLSTTGTIGLANAKLANYDLGSKLRVLEGLAGIKSEPETSIQTFSVNVADSQAGTALDNIQLVVPSIGQMTGAGTIDPSHGLNFKMRVAVQSLVGAVAEFGSKGGIPFTISGTSQDPSFHPDVRTLTTEKLKEAFPSAAASGLIKGLLGGKKTRP